MYRSRRQKGAMARALVALCLLAVATGVTVVWWTRHYYHTNLQPLSLHQATKSITIPSGYTLKQSSALLKEQGLIRNAIVFEQYVRSVDASDKIKAGTYDLSPSYSVPEIVSIITEGKVKTNLVTILPGQTLRGVEHALLNAGYTQSDVTDALKPSLYTGHPALVDKPKSASLEGYLYPDSFQKTADTSAQTIVRSSLDEMQKRLTPERREAFARRGLSTFDALTLASIVEKEVSNPSDKPIVAQVFLKRLQIGMMLGSDVTAIYGSQQAGQGSSLTYDTPYNTHIHTGLPPGPISNVSESSLDAVANPASTDWLFFVAGDDGKTYFARTVDQHNANVATYCHKLCSQYE